MRMVRLSDYGYDMMDHQIYYLIIFVMKPPEKSWERNKKVMLNCVFNHAML